MGGFHTWNKESGCYASSQSLKNEESFNTLLQIIRPEIHHKEIWKQFFMWTTAPWCQPSLLYSVFYSVFTFWAVWSVILIHTYNTCLFCATKVLHILDHQSDWLIRMNGLSMPHLLPIVLHLKVVIWCKNREKGGRLESSRSPSSPLSAQAVQILARFNVSNRPCRIPDSSTLPTRLIHGASIEYRGRRGLAGVVRSRKGKEIEML